jgi:hypothetical protein
VWPIKARREKKEKKEKRKEKKKKGEERSRWPENAIHVL